MQSDAQGARPSLLTAIKARRQAQDLYSSDPKFKKFGQQVEKCLSSFDNVQEWADCIAFLKNLLKTLQAYAQYKDIPRKPIVSKRLSQCLNPALPTGVHQRALEVYSHIFSVLGSEGIKRDLSLWTSGIFPFFEYAATSLKPTLLNIYDTHLLPLQESLRPSMRAFILCLLPGLEEETGEFFDQVLSLLDRLSGTVSPAYFFQNIWLILLTAPSARGTALNFLSRRLPRLNADEDITPIVGKDTGLLIRAFAAALEDENLLVQRSALDLLLQSLRLDSKTVKEASGEDREILMRAAYSVVLRRDLSLNRRLYTWLLGGSESAHAQEEFFRKFGLSLLASTLKVDMRTPSDNYAFSRPFKVFISLLDKWEIGGPLSDDLVIEALRTIKSQIEEGSDDSKDVATTASTLYEAVEPSLLWKHLLHLVISDLVGTSSNAEGIRLATFTLQQFHHDEEVQRQHIPVVLAAVLDLFKTRLQDSTNRVSDAVVRAATELMQVLVDECPVLAGAVRPILGESTSSDAEAASTSPLLFSCKYYGITTSESVHLTSREQDRPLVTVLQDLFDLSVVSLDIEGQASEVRLAVSGRSLAIITSLVQRADIGKGERGSLSVPWAPSEWLTNMLNRIRNGTSFVLASSIISTTLNLSRCNTLHPSIKLGSRAHVETMIDTLFGYLRPEYACYHHRAVQLIWSLDAISTQPHVESIIASKLSARRSPAVLEAFEAFGVLWRLTDDETLPGTRLKVPMLIVLHALSNEDMALRQAAESWLRNYLRSVLRVLDPILVELLQLDAHRTPVTLRINGKELPGYYYDSVVDQRHIHHLLDVVLAVVRHGGQSFIKAMRSAFVHDSPNPDLIKTVAPSLQDASYLEVLLSLLISYLQTEPHPTHEARMTPFNLIIQSTAVELLQAIVSRGGIDDVSLKTLEATATGRLYLSIHRQRLEIQNKLLHLLHSILSATFSQEANSITSTTALNTSEATEVKRQTVASFVTKVLIDGVTVATNRPVFQHWLDFIIMTLPKPQFNLTSSIVPIIDSIARELRRSLVGTVKAFEERDSFTDVKSAVSDLDFVMYLNAIESLVLASLTGGSRVRIADGEGIVERTASDTGGLFGFFASDTTSHTIEEPASTISANNPALRQCVSVLFSVIIAMPRTKSLDVGSMTAIFEKVQARTHRVLEHLWRSNSTDVLECLAHCWSIETESLTPTNLDIVFDVIDTLASGSQTVIQMLCDMISSKITGSTDKSKKPAATSETSEWVLFSFLEHYLGRLEGPVAVQVWPRFMLLAKEISTISRESRPQAYATLRCMTVLAVDVVQASGLDDRRLRREFQDTYIRLLDASISIVVSRDQGLWTRRKETLAPSGRDSPIPRTATPAPLNEKSASVTDLSVTIVDDKNAQVIKFITASVLPNLRRFLVDTDRVTTACTNVAYNIVTPAMKSKARPLDVDENIFSLIQALSSVPGSLKSWRGLVYDALNDARVFNSSAEAGQRWHPVLNALMDADRSIFPETLGKIATAPSANIFVNREYEMLLQSLSLRRLSYILFAGDKNHYLAQLPSVVEKLVDIFKNISSAVVQSEVYLCLRVLLCRLSPHNLTSFWPVVLTELYRTFEQLLQTMPPDGSETLPLILSASKFIDLLLVLQTEEFQIHQWIFITDTVDAIYRPSDVLPEGILDQLAEVAADLPVSDARSTDGHSVVNLPPTPTPVMADRIPARRPMLKKVRQIDSVRDLVHFFSHVSIASYESVYASPGNVDWVAVEQSILQDMFDGR